MAQAARITILGFGSLLSERSARTTFPDLTDFRLCVVKGYRRCFAHPAAIFFKRGIAKDRQVCSLSAEEHAAASFVCTAFEVTDIGMDAFREREEEFRLDMIPYATLEQPSAVTTGSEESRGLACLRWTDDEYVAHWGQERFERDYVKVGMATIWGWPPDSGLEPCHPYLRHCVLAATKLGDACLNSFLDDTFLIDRTTTLRLYLEQHPEVMETLPPPELAERYGG